MFNLFHNSIETNSSDENIQELPLGYNFIQSQQINLNSYDYGKYYFETLDIKDYNQTFCQINRLTGFKGFNIFMYEPFIREVGSNKIDITQVLKFIHEIECDINNNGLYDIVILDSVLNSITSIKMLNNVLLTCNALMKKDGKLIIGTRSKGKIISTLGGKHSTDLKRDIEFLDDNNFSVTFRNGVWTKQRFSTKETLYKELSRYFENIIISGNEKI